MKTTNLIIGAVAVVALGIGALYMLKRRDALAGFNFGNAQAAVPTAGTGPNLSRVQEAQAWADFAVSTGNAALGLAGNIADFAQFYGA